MGHVSSNDFTILKANKTEVHSELFAFDSRNLSTILPDEICCKVFVKSAMQTPKPTFGAGQLSKDLSDLLMSQNVKKTQFVLANSSFEGTEMQGYCVNLVTNTIY